MGTLPFELRSKILHHLYAATIHSVPLLQRLADDDVFLTDICIRLQRYSCGAQTFVYQRGAWGRCWRLGGRLGTVGGAHKGKRDWKGALEVRQGACQ